MIAWTDYPILELGDKSGELAPIRECQILSWDSNKYCRVRIQDLVLEIKSGYLYTKPGRSGEVPCHSKEQLEQLLRHSE